MMSKDGLIRIAVAAGFALATFGIYVWVTLVTAPALQSPDPPPPTPSCLPVTLGESAWSMPSGPTPSCISVTSAIDKAHFWWQPGHPRRVAHSAVSVTPATSAEVATFPFKKEANKDSTVGPPAPGAAFAKVSITHTVRLGRTDPVLKELSSFADASELTNFIQSAFGNMDTDSSSYYYGTYFYPPKLDAARPDGSVPVTFTAIGYSQYLENSPLIGLELTPPDTPSTASSTPPFKRHTVHVSLTGWSVAGVTGQVPSSLRLGSLDLAGQTSTHIALVLTGSDPSPPELDTYLTDGTLPSVTEPETEPESEPEQREYELLLGELVETVLLGVTSLALAFMLARALGRAWWRRRSNWALIATFTVFAALWFQFTRDLKEVGGLLLLSGVAVRHAVQRLGVPRWTASRWVSYACAVALTAGLVMAAWLLYVTKGAATWAAASLLALVMALLFLPGRRAWALPSAALAALGLAVLLFLRAGILADFSGWLLLVVLHLLWWPILVSGLAVSTRRWSITDALLCLAALIALDAIYVTSPQQFVTAEFTDNSFIPLAVPLVVMTFLVIRLCRLGRSPDAIGKPEAYATAVVVLMTLYLAPATGGVGVSSLLSWAAVAWLLSGTTARQLPSLVITSLPAHRSAIQAAIRRRFMRSAERTLFRTGRDRIASGELTVTDYEGQSRALEQAIADERGAAVDPDLAFATTAARPPWESGLIGAGVALILTVPLALIHQWPLGSNSFAILYASRSLLTLPAFGFFFGYFYPRVRGTRPLTKALHLLLAAAAVQISTKLTQFAGTELDTMEKLALLGVVAGDTALFAIGLGLFWEWRLMRLAEEPWNKIRNVRSIRALAAPLSAVLIAAVTAVTTNLASGITDSFRPAPLPPPSSAAPPTTEQLRHK
ncbi:hypothetical protein [Nonomuraea sp. WAC 01424]|uniref:hypothetical protein n=1 Tax=Nonomuraea sp. WAC 01424 TaxID=2203200 RepID=UPI000F788314|nr:hypothetical protein [Nonomuraea sp. WAC 01424]